jgi:hypothetical protein
MMVDQETVAGFESKTIKDIVAVDDRVLITFTDGSTMIVMARAGVPAKITVVTNLK